MAICKQSSQIFKNFVLPVSSTQVIGKFFSSSPGDSYNNSKKMQKVFVYGTLKQNEPNHSWLTKSENGISKFVCKAETIKKYPLVIATKYNIPFLLGKPGVGHNVKGEVYDVDEAMLKNLDILEDHPNFYVRELDQVRPVNNQDDIQTCWVYFLKSFKESTLKKPFLMDYSSDGDHGLRYCERCSRRHIDYEYKNDI